MAVAVVVAVVAVVVAVFVVLNGDVGFLEELLCFD